jgi:tetratricopeptide (TPR) repeat protein
MSSDMAEAGRADRALNLAADAGAHLTGPDGSVWMSRLEEEHEDLRAAFAWFLDHGRGAEALQLAADLWMFQEERGHADEGRAWLAKALAAPGAGSPTLTLARALYGAGILAFRGLDDAAAQRSFDECLTIARGLDDVRMVVRAASGLARVALRRGDTHEVRRWSQEALAIARERGDKGDAMNPLHMLAAAARVDGDIQQAKAFYRETLALNRDLSRPQGVRVELLNLGAMETLAGNIREAEPLLRESLEMAHKDGDRYLAPYDLIWLGRVALAHGNPARAATLFAAARAQFDATGLAMDPDEGPEYERGLAAIQGALDGAAFAAAWADGERMSPDDAVTFALAPQ